MDRPASHYWGIDIGMSTTVICVVGLGPPKFVSIGSPPPKSGIAEKLDHLHQQVGSAALMLSQINGLPEAVAVERQIGKFIKPHSHYAAGTVILALHRAFLRLGGAVPIHEVSTGTWKMNTVGKGNADKDHVAAWAEYETGRDDLTQDQADAYGIAESMRLDLTPA